MRFLSGLILAVAVVFGSFSQSILASETVKGAKADIEKVKQELSAKLDNVEADIQKLTEKAKKGTNEASEKTLAELKESKEKISRQLGELKDDGRSKWKKVKVDLANSIDKLSERVQSALRD
jgi:hypothetical protein